MDDTSKWITWSSTASFIESMTACWVQIDLLLHNHVNYSWSWKGLFIDLRISIILDTRIRSINYQITQRYLLSYRSRTYSHIRARRSATGYGFTRPTASNGLIYNPAHFNKPGRGHVDRMISEEVGYCMLPYVRDQILELVNESLLVTVL